MRPDFSPAMLRLFLRARTVHFGARARGSIRRHAGVTRTAFDMAWMGRLLNAKDRLKLWLALDVDPERSGVRLLDGGKQEDLL